ncbi:MAG: Asp-tRNA(Asn)/Glu-tRNA(Gln) amidotransferase subunit GatA [Thermogutta sp.]|nr:Asp-tRNA(Asn)/Glu-tRNA(Gln) amidotransferase subunit GatA [Thermogutta sp.]
MASLCELTAAELSGRLRRGECSAVEVARACLDRIAAEDAAVGAFLSVEPEWALAQAEAVDRRRRAGETLGPLAGIPVAIKDNLCVQGRVTSCASRMLANFRSPYHATVVERLLSAGAVIVGKTNLDEFAMGGSTETSAFHPTRNPWDAARIPGGSSGGSAASVAARMVPLSVGSDTGGSIRQPAALCGISGLKPTYGRVSRFGLVAFASSLDQIGPLAQSAEDCALLLETLAGHDPRDSTSLDRPVPSYTSELEGSLEGLRIGWVPDHFTEGLDPEVAEAVREALRAYEGLGAELVEVSLPHARFAVAAYYIIAPSEASSNLARYDGVHYGYRTDEKAMSAELEEERRALQAAGDAQALEEMDSALVRLYRRTRAEGFGAEVKRRIMLGTYALSAGYYEAYYLKALKVRRLIREDYDRAFAKVDVIAGPVTPAPAFRLGEKLSDPLAMYLFDLYTVGANLAGLPALSIPCGFSREGLPIGLHLQAPALEEGRLLRAAHALQQITDRHRRRPASPGPGGTEIRG